MSSSRICPLVPARPQGITHPTRKPAALAYSFTVPGEPRSAAVARDTVRTALYAHGLAALAEPGTLVASELVACAARFAPGEALYLSLSWRDSALRTVLWDPHPARHHDPVATAICAAGRKRLLLLLACVVRECRGKWGVGKPVPADEGTTVWVSLPLGGAVSYTEARC
ncbi:hypothetical protein FHS39_000564 [Streptomyces olivoverticillatus]|uniref:ATP-binding protein n=1 Tax=Streptomyces olivoverticillatus TaxID=66427 RepID=A0A7W7LJV0_9ACTN|nr:ATP-binding protein [Streptomyces olivoverticillatus]MBB4891564.1 hypothetical protein [Streptomyces olivoverticillatus]